MQWTNPMEKEQVFTVYLTPCAIFTPFLFRSFNTTVPISIKYNFFNIKLGAYLKKHSEPINHLKTAYLCLIDIFYATIIIAWFCTQTTPFIFNGIHKKLRCKIKGNFTKCFLMVFEQELGKTTTVLQTWACEARAGQPCGRVENSFSLLVLCRK